MLFNLTNLTSEPIQNQILNQYLQKILQDDFYRGKMLPTPRALAGAQHVSVTLIEKSFEYLTKEKLVQSAGDGDFIVPSFTEKEKKLIRKKYLSSYSAIEVVEKFSQKLLSVYDREKLCRLFRNFLEEILKIKKCQFFLKNSYRNEFDMVEPDTIENLADVVPGELFVVPVREKPLILDHESAKNKIYERLFGCGYRLIYPLIDRNNYLGAVMISNKKSGDLFTCDDLNLLKVLVNQFTVSISTARFYAEAVERRRLMEEMKIARQLQKDLLPKMLPCDEQISVAAYSKPAETVGGDFYDYVEIDENRIALIIGDASGKGLSAAMMISQIQTLLKLELKSGKKLEEIVSSINKQMFLNIPKDKFLTLFIGILNRKTLDFNYVNAGHCHPIILGKDKSIRMFNSSGFALRLSQKAHYKQVNIQLKQGDIVAFYSDGIIESMDSNNHEFGEDRLIEILKRGQKLKIEQIISKVNDTINSFTKNQKRRDDQTLMILKISS